MMCSRMQGFTLIEIMVVVVILGILAAIAVPRIMDNPERARCVKASHDIQAIQSALNLYKLDNFIYPTTDQGLRALTARPALPPEPRQWKNGGYMQSMPKDPWGRDYLYLNPGVHGEVDIFSYGVDGREGGEGACPDVGNWQKAS